MKTHTTRKTLIGTSVIALAVAFGVTQASAFSLGEFFGFSSGSNSKSSVRTNTQENASVNTNTNSNTSVYADDASETAATSLRASATGMIESTTNASLNASSSTGTGGKRSNMGQSVSGYANSQATSSAGTASSTEWNPKAQAKSEASLIARIAAWFRTVFHIGQFNINVPNAHATSTASTTLDGTASTTVIDSFELSPNINAFMHANVNAALEAETR